jgi:FemAB-related protein (PEP-CTERM system-associated)
MADVLGHECRYLVATDSAGRWSGLLPLVRVRSRLFGHYLLSMPFLNYGGPIGSEAAQRYLVEHAVAVARGSKADLLELRCRTPIPADLVLSKRKITVVLELPSSPEILWRERFPSKLRSQIRRPQKEGMEVRFGPAQVEPFYEVFCRNMRELGTPVLPRSFFQRVDKAFNEIAVFGAVYWRGLPVAAGCGFRWGTEFELTWASSLREHSRMAPNMLLYWGFMEKMISCGVRLFNFGRCTPGGGTHRFKRQWGGDDLPLPWAQWTDGDVHATPSPERPLYRAATAVWRRLPLPVTNRVGPVLARHLP